MSHSSLSQVTRRRETLKGLGKATQKKRYLFQTRILILPFDQQIDPFWAITDNLSHQGIFINSKTPLPQDTHVVLQIYSEKGLIRVTGQVRHRIPGFGFGCKFYNVSMLQKSAICSAVALCSSAPVINRVI